MSLFIILHNYILMNLLTQSVAEGYTISPLSVTRTPFAGLQRALIFFC